MDQALGKETEAWTSVVSVAELVSKYKRSGMDETPAVRAVATLSKVGVPSALDAQEAGRIYFELKPKIPNFGLADSFVIQLARKTGSKILTGDPDFAGVKEAQIIG